MNVLQRFLLVALFGLVSWTSLQAQNVYELKFTDAGGVSYKGLLVAFNDNKMYMRVAYYAAGGEYRVVNVDYTSQHTTFNGVEYLILWGSNPRYITSRSELKLNESYNPDHLYFSNVLALPMITDNLQDPNRTVFASSFRELSSGDVSVPYLREFYGDQESDLFALKRMFGLYIPTILKPFDEIVVNKPATLHFILAANTGIADIGAGCEVDKRNLMSEFKGIANTLGINYKSYLIEGDQFTKAKVQSTLNNFSPGSNDVVIFIYRGHGFRYSDQTDTWPQLDFRASNYTRLSDQTTESLANIYQKIIGKGARLNIVFGDCCNNDIGLSQNTSNNFLVMQSNNNYNEEKLRKLFLESKGNVLSCSAAPGEYSWVNTANGGFYTVSFIQALREEISYFKNDEADWRDVFENTVKSAKDKTNACSNCTPQNGKYYYGVKN